MFQMEKAVHDDGEPVGTGIHHGHSLDFKEFFHILANQSDDDRMRVATLDEVAVLGLQAIGSAFTQIDTDGSGAIDRQEFDVLCAAMGAYLDPKKGGSVREMWSKLASRKSELPFLDFLEQTLLARKHGMLGVVFFDEVVWELRADDPTEMAAGWYVLEAEEQEERAKNPNWHHLDSTEEEEEPSEDEAEPLPEVITEVPSADSYVDAAPNPMSVRRTLDVRSQAIYRCASDSEAICRRASASGGMLLRDCLRSFSS